MLVAIFLAAFLIFSHHYLRLDVVTANDYFRALMLIVITLVTVTLSERIAKSQQVLQERSHDLGKRVKELNCLYGISHLIEKPDICLEDIFQGTVDLVPASWQYPEITCARINLLEGQDFKTDNFAETIWKQAVHIAVAGDRIGTLEVYYLEQKPESDEGPFLREERNLLNVIAERLAEIAMRTRATEQLSVLLESLPISLYSCKASEDFGITYFSSSVERITGYSPGHFIEDATFWARHVHPDDRDRVLAELPAQLMRDKHRLEYRFRIADGSYIWFVDTWRVARLPDGTMSHVVGIWQDITEEKRIAREAEYRLQQIVQTDRLASLGKVVAGVAHEINNPNSFITYNIPLLEETWQIFEPILTDYAASHPEWRKSDMTIDEFCQDMSEIIQAIKIGSERINRVVSNLKDFARLDETPYAKPVQVNEVIEKTLSIVGSQVSKYVTRPELNLAGNLPEIQGHAQKLEQVVANLVVNAVYAIPDKETGRLSITTRYIERLKSVLIEIEDNGSGMKTGVVERIFEPFFTTRRDAGGTGLGLSVSYGLIQEHNGIIGVLSRPGLGTRFTVFLPVDRDTKLDLRPSIFCVDDDVGFLSDLKMYFLDIKDMSFETTSDPDSVMAYLEEHPEVDIVLADIMMPGINGWELLEKIKARFSLLPVILYTGYPSALKEKPYGGPEPDHLLQKPFRMEQMLEFINTIGRQRL